MAEPEPPLLGGAWAESTMPATVFSYDENYLMVIDVYILEVCPSSAAGARSQRRSRQTGETRSQSQNSGGLLVFRGVAALDTNRGEQRDTQSHLSDQ